MTEKEILAKKAADSQEWPRELLLSLLARLNIKLQTALDQQFKPLGLTAQEATLLLFCVAADETSPAKLAASMERDKAKITKLIQRLEANQLIHRAKSSRDQRVTLLRVRPRGKALVPQIKAIFEETRTRLFEEIPKEEIERLGEAVSRIYLNAKNLRGRQ